MNSNQNDIAGQSYSSSFVAKINAGEAQDRIGRVTDWWTAGFEGNSQKVGDVFTVRFSGDTFVDFKVIESIPNKKSVWLVTDCNLGWIKDKKEWKDTKVVWELAPSEGGTQVSMTHVGLVPGIECYNDCKLGWDFYTAKSLQKFLKEGKGLPDGERRSQ